MTGARELIQQIDNEYDRETGFLGRLRMGDFDREGADRLLGLLQSLDLDDGPVDKRLVQLLWFMPIFIQWQLDRVAEDARDDTQQVFDKLVTILETKIGVP